MASLTKENGRNSWKLRWYDADNKRKAIRLGSMPKKSAEQFRVKFEELEGTRRGGGSLQPGLIDWLDKLDPELRDRLADTGLIERQRRVTVGTFCDEFTESRSGVATATAVRDRQVVSLLIERFGRERALDSITVRDAEEWQTWLRTDGNKRDKDSTVLSDNTVRRRTGVARQIFATAIRWKLLRENPFDGLATTVRENLERREFVTWVNVLKVIKVAPTTEWKALIAFVRLTACRVPSELVGLTWSDVDFVAKRIVIRSPKTKHHGGEHAVRSCPMFPELVPYLEALAGLVGPGVDIPLSSPVFPIASDPRVNLRTQLSRLIVQSGLAVWSKLFVNMRSSRETELLAVYPVADVCRWLGHSPAVAARFYAQARSEVADKAAMENTVHIDENTVEKVGSKMGPVDAKSGSKMGPVGIRHETERNPHEMQKPHDKHGVLRASDGVSNTLDETDQWAVLDSNQRPQRCQRCALTN
jgi:integrase